MRGPWCKFQRTNIVNDMTRYFELPDGDFKGPWEKQYVPVFVTHLRL